MSAADPGAVPIVRLAELESAAHHLRDQTDRDRRSQAARNRDFREDITQLRIETADNTKTLAALVATLGTVKWLVGVAIALVPIAVGAAWALGRLIR